jgi:hypothetical protein
MVVMRLTPLPSGRTVQPGKRVAAGGEDTGVRRGQAGQGPAGVAEGRLLGRTMV